MALLVTGALGPTARAATLFEQPTLIVDTGMHAAETKADAAGRYAVTGSHDKTLRIWSLDDGRLVRTIRMPAGPGQIGKIFAVAISPDSALVAAGGWMANLASQESIYLFERHTGAMAARISEVGQNIFGLAFSHDGRYLAAVIGGTSGLRVYDRDQKWNEVFRDTDYDGPTYGVEFAADGRLATASYDQKIRLYSRDFVRKEPKRVSAGGGLPYSLAFSPDGNVLAVGFRNAPSVELIDSHTLETLPGPDTRGIENGELTIVAWSTDGQTVYAGGTYNIGGKLFVIAWADRGRGMRHMLSSVGTGGISSIIGLPNGKLLVSDYDPSLGVLKIDGTRDWYHGPPKAEFRGQERTFSVSANGTIVEFGFDIGGGSPLRFDLEKLTLTNRQPGDYLTEKPRQTGLPIKYWNDTPFPTIGDKFLDFIPYDLSRSLAIHPDGERFVLGTSFKLNAYNSKGERIWRRDGPSEAWAVNITGDGRILVAGYGDGTIRWHRMDDGRELLALSVLDDKKNWVAWTPEGFYAATPGAHGVLRWHVNRGFDAPGFTVPVSKIPKLRRPEALVLVLQELETARALGIADLAAARYDVQLATGTAKAPGARLHVLTIGVSDYGDKATFLRLNYAHKDAEDVASALVNTQGSIYNKIGGLYADVKVQVLTDENADKAGIFRALDAVRKNMEQGSNGQDLAVVMFSGHGTVIDGQFYLLPYGINARTTAELEAGAILVTQLRGKLAKLAEHGRVLLLLDACRSGAATADGTALVPNASLLQASLSINNVTVLTSSKAEEFSREDKKWENGAFTEVLLEAFGRAADTDKNSLISMTELTSYVATNLPVLTRGDQHLGIEQRFSSDLFVSGL